MSPAPLPSGVHPVTLALCALLPPLVLWVALAARQAWTADPHRGRRRAQLALQRLTQRWRGRTPSRLELESWRELCGETWGLSRSAPRAGELAAAVTSDADPAAWARLWDECERALYGAGQSLPADWPERAERRAAALPPWPALPWLPVRRAHWLPPAGLAWAAVAIASVSWLGRLQAAAPAAERTAWLQQIAREPGDWPAHLHLAVSYAGEEQWGQAAGHWTAAFLLNPRPPEVAAGFRRGLEKLEGAEPRLTRLASGRGAGGLAARLSAARWEEVLRCAAGTAALGLATLVWSRYVGRRRPYLWTGLGLVMGAGVMVGLATMALRVYGPLASPRAAVVVHRAELRTIPSDIAAKESFATLPAGAVVMVIRSFFGWDQVVLSSGTVAWARTESLLWIYRHRDDTVPARELD